MKPRKFVARMYHVVGDRYEEEKVFCKWFVDERSLILHVDFFLPSVGFGLIWGSRKDLVLITSVRDTKKGRACIVGFDVHPLYWVEDPRLVGFYGNNVFSCIEKVLREHIRTPRSYNFVYGK